MRGVRLAGRGIQGVAGMTGEPWRKPSIRLKHLLLGAGGGILLCCAIVAGHFLAEAWTARQDAQTEAEELARYEVVLIAAGAISAERGPANNAMTSDGAAVIGALHQKRVETDRRLAELLDAFRPEVARGGRYFADFALLKAHLRSARVAVDRLAALPLDKRSPDRVAEAVAKMFRCADAAFALRDKLGGEVIARTRNLSAEIFLVNEAGALREAAGRLGSYTMLRLAGSTASKEELAAMAATRTRLALLWHDLRLFAPAHLKTPNVREAVEATNQTYFLGALPYLNEVLRLHEEGRTTSAKAFTDRYVRGLEAAQHLRAQIIRDTVQGAQARAHAAGNSLLAGAVAFGMACALLFGFAFVVGRLLFSPLLAARNQILALAGDSLAECRRGPAASRELEEIFDSIAVLRQQLREKKEMEQEQRRLTETLRFLSERDPLTQLLNRRTVEDLAIARMRDSDSNNWPVGVLIVDLDHFKRVNDTYGHAAGDVVLKTVADQMRRVLRGSDIVARFGGEEFLIILDLSDGAPAVEIAERLRRSIAALDIEHEPRISVTASIGLCVRTPGMTADWGEIVTIADRRLYSAKAQGRNRVCATDEGATDIEEISPGSRSLHLRALR